MKPTSNQPKRQLLRSIMQVVSVQTTAHLKAIIVQLDPNLAFELNSAWIAPHLKLVFANAQGEIVFPKMNDEQKIIRDSAQPSLVRTFSIADFDQQQKRLTILFARHAGGIAGQWAEQAQVGDKLGLLSLGGRLCYAQQYLVMLGDLSALPAIAYTLKQLPADAQGRVALCVPDSSVKQALNAPNGVQIEWLITDATDANPLVTWLNQLVLPQLATPLIWGGLERQLAQAARRTVAERFPQLSRQMTPILNYWQQGAAEGEFRHREDVV